MLREEERKKMGLLKEQHEMIADLEKASQSINEHEVSIRHLDILKDQAYPENTDAKPDTHSQMEIARLSSEVRRLIEEIVSVQRISQDRLLDAEKEWNQASRLLTDDFDRLKLEFADSEQNNVSLRTELDRVNHEYKMQLHPVQKSAKEAEARLSEMTSKIKFERSEMDQERNKHSEALAKLSVTINELERDRKEFAWLLDKLRKSVEFSKNRGLIGWESEMQVEAFGFGSEPLQGAATHLAILIQALSQERSNILILQDELDKLNLKVNGLEMERIVLQSETGRVRVEAEEAQRGLRAARELVEELRDKIRQMGERESWEELQSLWQGEKEQLQMTISDLNTTIEKMKVLIAQTRAECDRAKMDLESTRSVQDTNSQRDTFHLLASQRRCSRAVKIRELSSLQMCFAVMHKQVWLKRKLERRLMLIYRRRTCTTLRVCLIWWERELDHGARLRSKVDIRCSLALRSVIDTAFWTWLTVSEKRNSFHAIVIKFRRRWARPPLFELSLAFAKWAADTISSQALARSRWEKLAVSAAIEKLHTTCHEGAPVKIGLKQLLLSSKISSRACSQINSPGRSSVFSSPSKSRRNSVSVRPSDGLSLSAFTPDAVFEDDSDEYDGLHSAPAPAGSYSGGDRWIRNALSSAKVRGGNLD